MNKTPIEWCDFTVNPFRFRNLKTGKIGHHCTKISPGCKNCYSGEMQKGPYLSGLTFIEENKPKGEFFLDENVLQQVLKRRKPCKVFWCDMTDMFLDDYPDEWIDRCFAVMALTPHLTHQVLTKRSERLRSYINGHQFGRMCDIAADIQIKGEKPNATFPLRNVWLGISVEDCERKSRIEDLRKTPAAVRFLSCEPLLEGLGELDLGLIDWAIIGGESGKFARSMNIAWARYIVHQCKASGTAPFVKQLGTFPRIWSCRDETCSHPGCGFDSVDLKDKKGGNILEWPIDLRVREWPRAE